jgi:hypothetical protein
VALVRDFTNDRTLKVRLDDVPEFVTARELGEETFLTGIIPRAQFKAAVRLSVELNLVNDVLNAGVSISGAKAAPPILLRLAEAPGFDEWYQRVSPKRRRWRLW